MNTELEFLNLNYNDLDDIDVSLNEKLTGLGCSGNNLTDLVLTNNDLLTSLGCSGNSISSLVLTTNTNLETITCYGNGMTSLTLPVTNTVTRLDCYNNNLTGTLDVSDFTNLEILWCYNNSLSGTLNLSSNELIENVDCSDNNLGGLLLPDTTTLFRLVCDNNQITSLDASQNSGLTTFWCFENQILSLLVPTTNGLTTLWCNNNNLTSLDVSTLTGLVNLDCGHNPMLTSLTLPSTPPLVNLWVYDVGFSNTNFLAGNTSLELLDIGLNGYDDADVDVSPFTSLTELYCNGNNLTTLNLAGNSQLLYLGIYDNALTQLNLENNLLLEWVSCGGNPTLPSTGVTLPSSENLTTFWAFGNGFTDLSFLKPISRANLQYFDVGDGNLTSIDVSDMIELIEFYCNGNSSLSYLDISNNFNDILDWMWAHNTDLTCVQVDSKIDADSRDTYLWQIPGAATYEEMCATASTENFALSSISIYPNPTKDVFEIDLNIDVDYKLHNILGQEVLSGSFTQGINKLDVSSISSGLYILNLNSKIGSISKKLVKN
ncbi:MAG TPA: T9SS type A sorting domain-containing protein [Flavobacteriaceae bacterium]|nr:T9SS type A sorting domain-containing protein [Flavobacteriaceae bacterium]